MPPKEGGGDAVEPEHVPVLASEVVELSAAGRGGVFVDCTLGLGGHAAALLEASPLVRLVGIDQDPEAITIARQRLAAYGDRVSFLTGNFRHLATLLASQELATPAGILLDLGVSSLQLDRAERGFSFRREGPLDMRMGPDGISAAEIVNTYSEADLERIIREFGEEREARRIARTLSRERERQPFTTTLQLADTIAQVKRASLYRGKRRKRYSADAGRIDPATRVFQALRIEANQELAALPEAIDQALKLLDKDGRLVVISYHSLEDRIVKHTFRDLAQGEVDPTTGRGLAETQLIEVLTKRPVRPNETEVAMNPRSRSARLRAARRL